MLARELLKAHAGKYEDKIAIVDADDRITYRELFEEVVRTSQILQDNVGAEDVLLTMPGKDIDSVVLFLSMICADTTFIHGERAAVDELQVDFPYSHILSDVEKECSDAKFFLRKSAYFLNRVDGSKSGSDLVENDRYIMSTSGTSGAKKHVFSSFCKLIDNARIVTNYYGLNEDIVSMTLYPPFRVFFESFIRAIYLGGKAVLVDSSQLGLAVNLMRDEQVNFMQGTSSQYLNLSQKVSPRDAESVKIIEVAGSSLSKKAGERLASSFHRAQIVRAWGSTETAGVCVINKKASKTANSIGEILPEYCVRILSINDDEKESSVGEMLIKGCSVTRKMLHKGEVINVPEYYNTADIVKIDECGNLTFLGRRTGMIKSAGNNIYPDEIESVLAEYPYVEAAAVVGVVDDLRGEVPAAYVQVQHDHQISVLELRKYCASHLDPWKIPLHWIISRKDIPVRESGKIDSEKIKEEVLRTMI